MRALTVRQPWATAIVRWGKGVENRTRNIAGGYRGALAIHAGLVEDEAAYDDELIKDALSRYDDSWLLEEQLVTGAFVGVVDLVGHESRWAYERTGEAREAHLSLAKRWRAAGHRFERDDQALTLTRRYDNPELGGYVDVITHIPWEDE